MDFIISDKYFIHCCHEYIDSINKYLDIEAEWVSFNRGILTLHDILVSINYDLSIDVCGQRYSLHPIEVAKAFNSDVTYIRDKSILFTDTRKSVVWKDKSFSDIKLA